MPCRLQAGSSPPVETRQSPQQRLPQPGSGLRRGRGPGRRGCDSEEVQVQVHDQVQVEDARPAPRKSTPV